MYRRGLPRFRLPKSLVDAEDTRAFLSVSLRAPYYGIPSDPPATRTFPGVLRSLEAGRLADDQHS